MHSTAPTRPRDGTSARHPLSPALNATLSDLRVEITQHLTDECLDGHMPDHIRRVAEQARVDGLRAEQVVIAFSRVWDNLPGAGHAAASRRDEIRWKVVSALITAYYDGDGSVTRPLG